MEPTIWTKLEIHFFFEMQLFISAGSEKSENTFGFYFFFELSMIYFWGARKKWKSQAKFFFQRSLFISGGPGQSEKKRLCPALYVRQW